MQSHHVMKSEIDSKIDTINSEIKQVNESVQNIAKTLNDKFDLLLKK